MGGCTSIQLSDGQNLLSIEVDTIKTLISAQTDLYEFLDSDDACEEVSWAVEIKHL